MTVDNLGQINSVISTAIFDAESFQVRLKENSLSEIPQTFRENLKSIKFMNYDGSFLEDFCELQDSINEAFPNVTAIDIEKPFFEMQISSLFRTKQRYAAPLHHIKPALNY
mmetsp:Transcript_8068/g.7140  ORF Transcript_8068/g.7140 Transcript_8068/m.7140 type:complete len:111 (+) Transcript_8068:590-922(+)